MRSYCPDQTMMIQLDSSRSPGLAIRGEVDSPRNGYQSLSVANDNTRLLGYHPATPNLRQAGIMKKSEARLPGLKPGPKKPVTKSPSLPKRQLSPDSCSSGSKLRGGAPGVGAGGNTLQLPEDTLTQHISRSLEELDKEKDDDSGTRENGSGCSDIADDIDGSAPGVDFTASDAVRTRAAMDHIQEKITKTMDQIKVEQSQKEANVNEYLRLAGEADKQQLQRIKQVFEKKNQKSTANLSHLQKKLEKYTKGLDDVQTHGAHRQTKDKLKDMGQGLKGVVGNIKGAKESIVSKPREFAHLIKNKFGSADNINSLKNRTRGSKSLDRDQAPNSPTNSQTQNPPRIISNPFVRTADAEQQQKEASEDGQQEEADKSGGGGTLPAREVLGGVAASASAGVGGASAGVGGGVGGGGGKSSDDTQAHSFKYGSDEENSSITSGSGFGAQSSPHSNSQNTSQQIVVPQAALDSLVQGLQETKEQNKKLQESLQRVLEEFECYKLACQQEVGMVKGVLEDDKFKMERMEEQMNDITELNQHEVNNLKQDIGSMEEKIEYRLEERTADIQDLLENCQTRVTKMELQQQQQQIISMEMVENVTFRTILTKLINVVLALLAVILVFVSTTANLVAPFLTTRARILSTAVLVVTIIISYNNRNYLCDTLFQFYDYVRLLLPNR